MGENIEVKDVQKTEYLDKNGLDMLWAKVKENTHNQVEIERNRAVAKENSIVDTKADKSALDNYVLSTALAEYAKKTDIPEVDTSDFVSKTTTDAQIINSYLGIVGDDKYIQIVNSIVDEDPVLATLSPAMLEFTGNDRSTIELNGFDVNSNKRSRITIEAFNENPQIVLNNPSISDTTFQNYLEITNKGISSLDNNANHVFATDGSIADLAQYAKKSEITAGGNVDDVQVNGVTVVENKIANIKPATKESLGVVKVGDGLNVTDGTISVDTTAIGAGNYVSYKSIHNGESYEMSKGLFYQYNNGFDSGDLRLGPTQIQINSNDSTTNITGSYASIIKGDNEMLINPDVIDFRFKGSQYFVLNENGLKLKDGDNNHVLTSNASTIDITQYVLKSVYDEKIVALEARIAALEAAA